MAFATLMESLFKDSLCMNYSMVREAETLRDLERKHQAPPVKLVSSKRGGRDILVTLVHL